MTKTMRGADCWTDHRLVSKLNLRMQPLRPQGKKVPKKLDVFKLKQDSKRQAFVNDLVAPVLCLCMYGMPVEGISTAVSADDL